MSDSGERQPVWRDAVILQKERMERVAEELQRGGRTMLSLEPVVVGQLLAALAEDYRGAVKTRLWSEALALLDAVDAK